MEPSAELLRLYRLAGGERYDLEIWESEYLELIVELAHAYTDEDHERIAGLNEALELFHELPDSYFTVEARKARYNARYAA